MDLNRAIKKARHNAILRKNLSQARADLFWLVLDGGQPGETEASIAYLHDSLADITEEYERHGETEQLNHAK